MNETLRKRFGRRGRSEKQAGESEEVFRPPTLNLRVRQYFEDASALPKGGHWLSLPEVPSSEEILDLNAEGSASSDIVELTPNRPVGAWESKEAYLKAHHALLREDALSQLRSAVSKFRANPMADESALNGDIAIYDKAHICAVTFSPRGFMTKITFSLVRVGKKILWQQSKRLLTGSLVVLSPKDDLLRTGAGVIVAVVAARPLTGLECNPPEIDIMIPRASEQVVDPAREYIMLQDRGSLFESSRHTLVALQKMQHERFPLSEHLVFAKTHVTNPEYLVSQPHVDLTSIFSACKDKSFENVNLLTNWPEGIGADLDKSQMAALLRMLSKSLAIVQGPPGTGKTHVSLQAVLIYLSKWRDGDPPIIIAAQTNHATDQLLRQIAPFVPDFVRLGGRSKDREVIKPCSLYEIRRSLKIQAPPGCLLGTSAREMGKLEGQMKRILTPLKDNKEVLSLDYLQNEGILTEDQVKDLRKNAAKWHRNDSKPMTEAHVAFSIWLGRDLVEVPSKQVPEDFGFDFEEADLEFEQLEEIEAENGTKDEDDYEALPGDVINIADNYTTRGSTTLNETKIRELMAKLPMSKIPAQARPMIYRFLQNEVKKAIINQLRPLVQKYNELAVRRRIGLWEKDENILRNRRVIGMTTTGLSKYRGLIAALQPKVVLIEEAGETLEAPVTVACLPSLQQLILVGDHQQLRPHCNWSGLEDAPFHLNISLFERLMSNKVEFDILTVQRRMRPEIRRLLHPVYGDTITDHPSVRDPANRPDVTGMGGVSSFFFEHTWPERRDEQSSSHNPEEADMVIGLVEYLSYNGYRDSEITILTFYNGQRKRILRGLREKPTLTEGRFNVVTVDSYQGEENKIVILSLVRSNNFGKIGFLDVANRICVALSRAQIGFYIFGNAQLLWKCNEMWRDVIQIMGNFGKNLADRLKDQPTRRVADKLTLRCKNHNNTTEIREPEDWNEIVGGCKEEMCGETRSCGHPCELQCHPFQHESIKCTEPCTKAILCGHRCSMTCGEPCECAKCRKPAPPTLDHGHKQEIKLSSPKHEKSTSVSNSSGWMAFSKSEPERYRAEAVAAMTSSDGRQPPKQEAEMANADLIDFSSEPEPTMAVNTAFALVDLGTDMTGDLTSKTRMTGTEMAATEGVLEASQDRSTVKDQDWSKEASLLD